VQRDRAAGSLGDFPWVLRSGKTGLVKMAYQYFNSQVVRWSRVRKD
jgi:hypothetical protein